MRFGAGQSSQEQFGACSEPVRSRFRAGPEQVRNSLEQLWGCLGLSRVVWSSPEKFAAPLRA
eukprot:8810435-Alexandrium_andersonii.AAC.1